MATLPFGAISARWARQLRAGGRTDAHRAANRRYRQRLAHTPKPRPVGAAADVRAIAYMPSPGLIAWSLLGGRVIR